MNKYHFQKIVFIVISWLFFPLSVLGTTELFQQGLNAFQQRAYPEAVENWEKTLAEELSVSERVETLLQLAHTYQILGKYSVAHQKLQQALELTIEPEQKALIHSRLGDLLLAVQDGEAAQTHLNQGIAIAKSLNRPDLLAHLLNNLGNVFSIQQNHSAALESYTQAAKLAAQEGERDLQIQALANQSRSYLKQNNVKASLASLETALSEVHQLTDEYSKIFNLLSLGNLALRIQESSPQELKLAHQILEEAKQRADHHSDRRLLAYAKGYLGQVYERAQRYPEAQQLTQEAIFLSQESPEILYLWEWQQGRIFRGQKDLTKAIAAYQRALAHLKPIRASLTLGQRDASEVFIRQVRPLYFGLADIILQQAAVTPSPEAKAHLLNQGRDTIEELKAAELQDYFRDECVSAMAKKQEIDELAPQTAVFYPILLPNRTELLLTLPDGIHQVVVPVGDETLTQMAVDFQKNLQVRTKWSFLNQSQQLYQWLIAPLQDLLDQYHINTLVIVPDGPLRMIPLAALHDGKQFLIERFALVVTPGLYLTDPRPLPRGQVSVLLQGLSAGVQNFSPLPNVPHEIESVGKLFSNKSVLLDKEFSLAHVNKALLEVPYSIVHIASHGQFNRDPSKTFILTYDDKLTMNRLEQLLNLSQLRKEPVELLALSACQTAVGDERAALGLAGVAIKAGARSALATLWFVNDEATSELVTEFYRQLRDTPVSKAQALQTAQVKLLKQQIFRHPAYWAPFLLIGNWL
ncbi:MAG: hypothetical protein BWK79_07040 [Beggiatoa sp. IS2]|nr:MAG: hypothetical protein BWK79_07040 [Beggiatoa sp. IS2]